jgi:hypothetical protein
VNGKESGDDGASPKFASKLPERQKQQKRNRRVQEHIAKMMRIQTEKLAGQHVRDRRKRMPFEA